MKDKLYRILPVFFQNTLISLYNYLEYKKRYGGNYQMFKQTLKKNKALSYIELLTIQKERYQNFINYVVENAPFYKDLYKNIEEVSNIKNITKLPIIDKETVRSNISAIYTIPTKKGIVSKTGGTTGKSLKVYFTHSDMQERFALLDNFRENAGYKLGKKTAWFSGKNLLTNRDVKRNRFWKTDCLHKVRYYSTFHIKETYLKYYVENLLKYQPEYIVGFPSSILEIAKYGLKNNYKFPENVVKGLFPTAETISQEMRTAIELFFHAKMYDQYASSEGAPFIFECKNSKLHLELQSGVFEVLDANNKPTNKGKLVVTSFTTEGTPLVRYDIGDEIELSNEVCSCGNNNPLVKEILGRVDDYVFSPENGKINLGNVSNTLKDTKGIVKFQVLQNKLNAIEIKLQTDSQIYNATIEAIFLQNWRDRLGTKMDIEINYVNEISNEKSGKFRLVKNNIKHLIESAI